MAISNLVSSSDVIVDRRFEWARESLAAGDDAGAADLLEQVLELAPHYAPAWFLLGDMREKAGDRTGAVAAFRAAVEHDPADRQGASLRLVRLGAQPSGAMLPGYVQALFGGYAANFDQSLVQALDYRAPDLLLRAVRAHACDREFQLMLDLGCGTGLAGVAFRPFYNWLVGVDLSSAMLAKASGKAVYSRLFKADVPRFLARDASIGSHYHLIVAADVFIYFDSLVPLLRAAACLLAPSGLIAFSLETHDGEGVILRDTLRYAHGAAHVRAAVAGAGLRLLSLDSAASRSEKGSPVPGLVVVAQGPSS